MIKQGFPVKELENQPELYADLNFSWRLFWKLNKTRRHEPMSGMPQSIKFSEINSLFQIFNISEEAERQWLSDNILTIDALYLEIVAKKIETKIGKDKAGSK